jgi:glycosyltransferase involved in cell wall biosynthesis
MVRTRVVLAGFYPPPFAGEPIHVKQLARFLRDRGLEVDILNLNRHAPPGHEYRSATKPWGLARLLFVMPDRSSILHLHTNGHNWKSWLMIVTAALATRIKGARALLTIHSGLFPGYVSSLGPARRRFARWILHSFVRVIAVNSEIGSALQRIGISELSVSVIPAFLGVSESGTLQEVDRPLVDGRRPVLVAVGGGDRDPEMGMPTVVDVLSELARSFPGLRAIFLGWQVGPKTQKLIESHGLEEYAVCLGEVSHERCLPLLQQADVVVRSTFADGDAITVREALDLGVPVVASDTAFRPDGVVLFRKGDSRDLLTKLRQVLSASGSRAERVAGTAGPARELWRIYAELTGGASTPRSSSAPSPQKRRASATPP